MSLWDSVLGKARDLLSRSPGPVPFDFALKEEEQDYTDVPLQPYSRFTEQEKFHIFETWMLKENKKYQTEREKFHRFEIFKHSMLIIDLLCANRKKPCVFRLTKTSDLSDHEIRVMKGWPLLPPHYYKDVKLSGPPPRF